MLPSVKSDWNPAWAIDISNEMHRTLQQFQNKYPPKLVKQNSHSFVHPSQVQFPTAGGADFVTPGFPDSMATTPSMESHVRRPRHTSSSNKKMKSKISRP